ncbi:MAG: PIG-L deacetylase family protein [Candidatus Acidiferrum sp.]
MKILLIAAHPDDELLGVGGTIAWHIANGDQVKVAVMCEGISARFSDEGRYELGRSNRTRTGFVNGRTALAEGASENGRPRCYVPERFDGVKRETYAAARILGVMDLHVGDLPDQRLETLPLSDVVKQIELLVSDFEPDVVYTHFAGDINRDHRVLTEAVLVAVRPYSAPHVREILMFETPSSTEWSSPSLAPSFQPNVYVDITPFLEQKIAAFNCYSAEGRPYPHPRSPQALTDRARYWGSLINRESAEPFMLVRSTR